MFFIQRGNYLKYEKVDGNEIFESAHHMEAGLHLLILFSDLSTGMEKGFLCHMRT